MALSQNINCITTLISFKSMGCKLKGLSAYSRLANKANTADPAKRHVFCLRKNRAPSLVG
jgi:hypothetical protein